MAPETEDEVAHQFSLLALCGKIPLDLWEQYFSIVGVGTEEIPWDTMHYLPLDRRSLSFLTDAMAKAPSRIQEEVLQDLTDVQALASDRGMEQLLITGKLAPSPVDLQELLLQYDGHHARTLAVRCTWPAIFRRAVEHHRIHGIDPHRWHRTARLEDTQPHFDERAQEQLREAISHYFVHQGRGRGCAVTVEPRGDDLYVFVYPEDAPHRRLAFNEAHTMVVETTRPALEIIFVWHAETQTVDCFATCPQRDRQAALQRFGRIMLDVDFFPDVPRIPVFQLDALKYRGYPFPVQREDQLLSVRVVRLRLADRRIPGCPRITVEHSKAQDAEALYDVMEDKLREGQATAGDMEVEEAQLRFYFRGKTPTAQPITRTVTLSMPDMLRLGRNDPYYPTIRTLLRRWHLDVAHTLTASASWR